jgi:hypothetical protein
MKAKHKTTMHRQGKGWIVSRWSEQHQMYAESHEMPYQQARDACGRDNCRNPNTCTIHEHYTERGAK